jgi:predicted aconitase
MTPDTIRKTTMIDENDTHTADLLRTVTTELESDKAARTEFTVAGFGTGTVAELEMYLDQIKGERDHLAALANSPTTLAALALYDAVGLATNTAMADLIDTVEEQADDIRVLRADLEDLEDRDAPDSAAIWAEIEDRVEETAAEAARQVIRDELVASVDLI